MVILMCAHVIVYGGPKLTGQHCHAFYFFPYLFLETGSHIEPPGSALARLVASKPPAFTISASLALEL